MVCRRLGGFQLEYQNLVQGAQQNLTLPGRITIPRRGTNTGQSMDLRGTRVGPEISNWI